MPNIAKHDPKQEGKDWNGKDCRIDFSVARDTIGTDDFLERCGKRVHFEVSGRLLICFRLSDSDLRDHFPHQVLDFILGNPYLRDEA